MRRIVIALMGTISGVVLLFSYHTSTGNSTSSSGSDEPKATDSSEPSQEGQKPSGKNSDSGDSGKPQGRKTPDPSDSDDSGGSNDSGDSGGSTNSGKPAGAGGLAAGTWTGQEVSTRWGTVQVQIAVQGGKITQARALQYPNDNPKDQEINAYALPILQKQVVAAQSAEIDGVSGATVTSEGYARSLQSAIDQAR